MADNRSHPGMLALLGLLAVAGYQNRDKIASVLGGLTGGGPAGTTASGNAQMGSGAGALGSLLGNLFGGATESGTAQAGAGALGGLSSLLSGLGGNSNVLSGGLGDIMKSFQDAGHGDVANSWVDPSVPTQAATPNQVETALGESNINELVERTGLSRDELLKRLATAIPHTVDKLTPNGEMPNEEQARRNLAA